MNQWPQHNIWLICFFLAIALPAQAENDLLSDFSTATDPQYQRIRVKRVIDTDTLLLENNEKIKLIGLKALPVPEDRSVERDEFGFVVQTDNPFPDLEQQALRFAKKLIENRYVRLEFDKQKRGPEFLALAYVFLVDEGTFVNEAILQNGYASLQIRPPNTKYAKRLRQAYRQGRRDLKGIHSDY